MINKVNNYIEDLWDSEDAVGVVEVILILVVLISLVIIFKTQMTAVVNKIFTSVTKGTNSIKI